MLQQGNFLSQLIIWLLLPQLYQPLSLDTCDNCGDKCWKCVGSTEVPYGLGNDLEILYLSDNVLDLITAKSFSTYRNIRDLHLNNCSLKNIPNDTFSDLKYLEWVDLSHNKISESLPETIFQFNGNLNVVRLNYNNFSNIKTAFLLSGSIHTLHMIGCNITEVSPESFKHLPQLKELNLEKNKLKVLPPNLFSPLKKFSKLFIDENTQADQSCTPGLHVFVGEVILDCDTVKLEMKPYIICKKNGNITHENVTLPTIENLENKTEGLEATNDIKYTQRTTIGLTKSTTQLSTDEKRYFTASTAINAKEPTQTLPNIITVNVDTNIIYLILIICIILLATVILYISVKYCFRPQSHSSFRQQELEFPEICYDNLIHSTENFTKPVVHVYRTSYDPVQMSPAPGNPDQVYRPVSMASQISDHSYQEIIYAQHNMDIKQ